MAIKNWSLTINRKASNPNSIGIVRAWTRDTDNARLDIYKEPKGSNLNHKYSINQDGKTIGKSKNFETAKRKSVKLMRKHPNP